MSAETSVGEAGAERFDALHAEAKEAVARAANTLRAVTEQYRSAYHASLADWRDDREALDTSDRRGLAAQADGSEDGVPPTDGMVSDLRRRIAVHSARLGDEQAELARLELAVRGLERTWLFLERGDASLLAEPAVPDVEADLQMRIVEAREAERTLLAREVHDGPAQALANAIFGIEYIEKILERDRGGARMELRFLRERLRRELGEVRAFINHLRPPVLDEVGLDGALRDAAETMAAVTGVNVEVDLAAPVTDLGDGEQVVVLRVLQEALQNVRKHAGAHHVRLTTREAEGHWILEVRDDGCGFDPGAVGGPGRRTFGLHFMRERAELVRGRFEVRSRPADGTVVVLDIPVRGGGGRT
jgi:signal transduction histidine kinase